MTMQTRRNFLGFLLQVGAGLVVTPLSLARELASKTRVLVNDIHSQLNPTYVREVVNVESLARLQEAVTKAKRKGQAISIAGGRHAMGGAAVRDRDPAPRHPAHEQGAQLR